MVQNHGSKGGRPRKQDPSVALTAAAERFWITGFAGTTLDDLSAATGMKRPSLYATFGDKRALYLRVLHDRIHQNQDALQAALAIDLPLAGILETVFLASLRLHLQGGGRGCFLLSTGLTPAIYDEDVAVALRGAFAGIESAFMVRFERENSHRGDAAVRAQLAAATIHRIAISVRSGIAPEILKDQVRAAAMFLSPASVPECTAFT